MIPLLDRNPHPSQHPLFLPRHGTRKRYRKQCRCLRCTEAERIYQRNRKRRQALARPRAVRHHYPRHLV